MLVSQARPNQPSADRFQYRRESDPRWSWLGLVCKTSSMHDFDC